jgi:hypothetical protein
MRKVVACACTDAPQGPPATSALVLRLFEPAVTNWGILWKMQEDFDVALGIKAPQEEEDGADAERPKSKGRQQVRKGGQTGKGRAVPYRHKSAAHRGGRGGKRSFPKR